MKNLLVLLVAVCFAFTLAMGINCCAPKATEEKAPVAEEEAPAPEAPAPAPAPEVPAPAPAH
ncbi:hypothetical protein KJ997_01265 [bacterium]|nr:hypothetical protein [bacterium]